MEIDFRTTREAIIFEIGIQTGILQREQQQLSPQGCAGTRDKITGKLIKKLQDQIKTTIEIIKGL